MKHFLLIILFITAFFVFCPAVFAHGGVSKNIGGSTVFLKQSPLSPKVGEEVTLAFRLAETANNQPLKNTDVELTLIQTFYGDESKDTHILTRPQKTDANGNMTFAYTFPTENYYDIELTFIDPVTKKEQTTGFLVQTRLDTPNSSEKSKKVAIFAFLGGIILGLLLSFLQKFIKRNKTATIS